MKTKYELYREYLIKAELPFCEEEPLSKHTTFRVGGNCRIMLLPKTKEDIEQSLALLRQVELDSEDKIPLFVLGNGSNLLVSDEGFDGVVLLLCSNYQTIELQNETELTATAGTNLTVLCQTALKHGLSGLEFAFGIPGSVGGATYMNAGAYGGEMKDVVVSVTALDESHQLKTYTAKELDFSYRHSVFSGKKEIILSTTFSLKPKDQAEIQAEMQDYMARRKDKQPLEYGSAGSTFKRPTGYFAGQLIEEAGLKGRQVGQAQVSEKHAGFIINLGGATAKDVKGLIAVVQQEVLEKYGVQLQPEVQML